MFCTCTRSCVCANDTEIMRSRDVQCNSTELRKSGFHLSVVKPKPK